MSESREEWKERRLKMEEGGVKRSPMGHRLKRRIDLFGLLAHFFKIFIQLFGPIYERAKRSAKELAVNEVEHVFDDLPGNFHDYRILHLTDLHLDERPDMVRKIVTVLKSYEYDLCVFTGDYYSFTINKEESLDYLLGMMKEIHSHINAKDGAIGVLGNHDSAHLVSHLEEIGISFLINESTKIERDGEVLQVLGTDDVHYFFSKESLKGLEVASDHFTLGLIHSCELFDKAEKHGVNLYLCGHSHGGQICLKEGSPIVKRVKRGRNFTSGKWTFGKMTGFTSRGVGTSTLPVRIKCDAEIVIHTLKSQKV